MHTSRNYRKVGVKPRLGIRSLILGKLTVGSGRRMESTASSSGYQNCSGGGGGFSDLGSKEIEGWRLPGVLRALLEH